MVVYAIETPAEFTEKAINSKKQVTVMFFRERSPPCKMMRLAFQKLSEDYPSIEFCNVDVDDLDQLTADWGVTSFPTFLFFKDGAQLNNFTVCGALTSNIVNVLEDMSQSDDEQV
ncbi:thioredoxin family protein [Aspergillus vadensis CBS 113365]|uniref:Thioredoxin-like protein n=1 Tax=Aspergillus vadensis (strain CBS 113365 / IMI 142717 / IBT 24658) TaxID=1448311 RepID=A0A319BKH4_ASPVC|nr:thioredoxin-like protein [Aspergillus vadensis CBS 113365]PYH72399.1 thioredoxin-like protein [Aspergillus vadensis CBS 113365]